METRPAPEAGRAIPRQQPTHFVVQTLGVQDEVWLGDEVLSEALLQKRPIAGQSVPLLAYQAQLEKLPERQLRKHPFQANVELQSAPELRIHVAAGAPFLIAQLPLKAGIKSNRCHSRLSSMLARSEQRRTHTRYFRNIKHMKDRGTSSSFLHL